MMGRPCAIVLSSAATPACDIVKLVVDREEFNEPTPLEEGITAYPCHIDCKYYTADIHICALHEKITGSSEFVNSVEAVIIYFDSEKNNGLIDAEGWEPLVEKCQPEVRILVCDHCEEKPSSGISKLQAQEWCIPRGFELVELNPKKDEEFEERDDFSETTGVPRIIEALQAHVWPGANMKGETSGVSENGDGSFLQILKNICLRKETPLQILEDCLREEAPKNGNPDDPNLPDDHKGDDYNDLQNMFRYFSVVKESLSSMPPDERKYMAALHTRLIWENIDECRGSREISDSSDSE